jgi:hypothetical protein
MLICSNIHLIKGCFIKENLLKHTWYLWQYIWCYCTVRALCNVCTSGPKVSTPPPPSELKEIYMQVYGFKNLRYERNPRL